MGEQKSLVILVIIFIIFVLVFLLGLKEEKARREQLKRKIKNSFGKYNKKKVSSLRYDGVKGFLNNHKSKDELDDITWHDLDLDNLFNMMNNTYSSCGEEYLYYTLRCPKHDISEILGLEKDVCYFENHEDERFSYQEIIAGIGKKDNNSVYDHLAYTNDIKDKCKNGIHYFSIIFLVLSIVCLFVYTGIGIILLIASLCFNIISYFKIRSEILPYINSLKYIMRVYYAGASLKNIKHDLEKECNLADINVGIDKKCQNLKAFAGKSKFVFASEGGQTSVFSFLRDYFNMIFHVDIIMFNSMIKILGNSYDDIDYLIEKIGYIESCIAIASFRKAVDKFCIPKLSETDYLNIKANNIYHPYIKNPVKNSFELNSSMLITGSNASGKSTFLRTVAINIIMSETINTALADSFECGMYYLYSSMSLSDNLLKGDSYYMAEIKAIKRILDNSNQDDRKGKIVCFVDEVLRGTNTVERIAASTEILKYFKQHGIKCFAATHDIELTSLLGDNGYYSNYHFEEEIVNNDIKFNYKLNEGKASSRNAILLLDTMGFSKEITNAAGNMAKNFTEKKEWEIVQ